MEMLIRSTTLLFVHSLCSLPSLARLLDRRHERDYRKCFPHAASPSSTTAPDEKPGSQQSLSWLRSWEPADSVSKYLLVDKGLIKRKPIADPERYLPRVLIDH